MRPAPWPLVAAAVALFALNACGNSSAPGAVPVGGGGSSGGSVVVPAASACSTVLPGAALTSEQRQRMIALRQKFLGAGNVDPLTGAVRTDRVIASWVSVTGYVLALQGHVLLLDAFIGNVPLSSNYSPTDDCELSDLRPELLFIGHGHYDHAQLTATLANRNRDLQVVGSGELCADLALAAAGRFTPRCLAAIAAGAPLASKAELPTLLPGIGLTVLKHPHSAAAAPANPGSPPALPVPAYPKASPTSPCALPGPTPDGQVGTDGACPLPGSDGFIAMSYTQRLDVSLLYQFRLGDFVLTWNNTNGPNTEGDTVLAAMAGLPQTDVQLGSILGFNLVTNGFADARHIAEALRTRLLIPGHHDLIGPYEGRSYQSALDAEFAMTPAATRPGMIFVSDRDDYLQPARMSFDPSAALWKGAAPVSEAQSRP